MRVYTERKQTFGGLISNVSPLNSCLSLQISDPMRWKFFFWTLHRRKQSLCSLPSQSHFSCRVIHETCIFLLYHAYISKPGRRRSRHSNWLPEPSTLKDEAANLTFTLRVTIQAVIVWERDMLIFCFLYCTHGFLHLLHMGRNMWTTFLT